MVVRISRRVRGADVSAQHTPAPRVLIAEDEPVTRLDLNSLLAEGGFEVCAEALDGYEAVRLALRHRPDAIVMDAAMPRLDGIAAAERILTTCDIPIVVLTGYRYGELIDRAFEIGCRDYVVKPFAGHELIAALRAAVAGRPAA